MILTALCALILSADLAKEDQTIFDALTPSKRAEILAAYPKHRFNAFRVASEFDLPLAVVQAVIDADRDAKKAIRSKREASKKAAEKQAMEERNAERDRMRRQREQADRAAWTAKVQPKYTYDRFEKLWTIASPNLRLTVEEAEDEDEVTVMVMVVLVFIRDEMGKPGKSEAGVLIFRGTTDLEYPLSKTRTMIWLQDEKRTDLKLPPNSYDNGHKKGVAMETRTGLMPVAVLRDLTERSTVAFRIGSFDHKMSARQMEALLALRQHALAADPVQLANAKTAAK